MCVCLQGWSELLGSLELAFAQILTHAFRIRRQKGGKKGRSEHTAFVCARHDERWREECSQAHEGLDGYTIDRKK